ncbi:MULTISPECIES: hypothetical protein [Bacillus]|uniref:hypothetical protein n=1 Tax=Bacillus velezensis TaxID=492670 RepID=UPI0015F5D403|nr:hypothetical protein [Bacillus velezensis]MCV2523161.1 hypothetical protein [Bacillus velezensis]MEC0384280.1 hypothetical protein [Bacillus velezensis]MEC3924416.1 hypothetical protein [Bacillus velezensis]QMT26512.1 hypothetical protein H2N97_09415 [Bacillus velezensis]WJM64536.1 hypothetical protein QTN48_11935 [Bacillus velezensis]
MEENLKNRSLNKINVKGEGFRMEELNHYRKCLSVNYESIILLVATPKGKYPSKSVDLKTKEFVNEILYKEYYIDIYEKGKKEILQDTAFKLFTLPLIGDSFDHKVNKTVANSRASEDKVEAFFVLQSINKEFQENNSNISIDKAIKRGEESAKLFLNCYPLGTHDVSVIPVERGNEGVELLLDMKFKDNASEYYFDFTYFGG